MIKCKFCGEVGIHCKYGKYNGIQKYRCKNCRKVFSDKIDTRYNMEKYDLNTRRLAITMYINNVGIRSIERILNVPNTLILKWVRNISGVLENILNNNKDKDKNKDKNKDKTTKETVRILEMDKLWTYYIDRDKETNKNVKKKLEYGLLLTETETILLHLK